MHVYWYCTYSVYSTYLYVYYLTVMEIAKYKNVRIFLYMFVYSCIFLYMRTDTGNVVSCKCALMETH